MDDESSVTTPPEITYEETPVITPIVDPPPVSPTPTPTSEYPKKKTSFGSLLKNILLLVVLFIIGYLLSGVIRNAINTPKTAVKPNPTPIATNDIEVLNQAVPGSTSASTLVTPQTNTQNVWKQYSPVNGTTRKAIETIQFKLPGTVLAPICDGSACGSQGTYLPGETRLTIAPRGVGQVLPDFRGKIISDAGGKAFVTKQITVAGKQTTDFATENVGSTVGGYAFSMMHGVMIEVTDTLSLELNHFAPRGITADFMADEVLFQQIIATITFSPTGSLEKGALLPTPIPMETTFASPTAQPLSPIR